MIQKQTPVAGGAAGALEDSSFATERPFIAEVSPTKQALTEAKRDLIRQALFEDLDAVRLLDAIGCLRVKIGGAR